MRWFLTMSLVFLLVLAFWRRNNRDDSEPVFALDSLVVLTPHRSTLRGEIEQAFKVYYRKFQRDVRIEWVSHGGSGDSLKFLLQRFTKNPNSAQIDVLWGGGDYPYIELDKRGFLTPHVMDQDLRAEIPQRLAGGILQYNDAETWHASALSSFGIFFNRQMIDRLPSSWLDLTSPRYFGRLGSSDPRSSSSALATNLVLLQQYSWRKGWEYLLRIAANTKKFSQSSSEPIREVVSGRSLATMSLGYFAYGKIAHLGKDKLGFVLPEQHIINVDPVAILKGAQHKLVASRFVDFLLSKEAQKLLLLPQGVPGGPRLTTLARMAVNQQAYAETEGQRVVASDPFKSGFVPFKFHKAEVNFVLADLFGSLAVDQHSLLVKAWKAVIARGLKARDLAKFRKMPFVESEVKTLAEGWHDEGFRSQKIAEWDEWARRKYLALAH